MEKVTVMNLPSIRNILLVLSLLFGCVLPAFGAGSVIMANGTYELGETDLRLPARGIAIDWTRSYRSNRILASATGAVYGELADGPLGFGWTTPYFARIENGDTWIDGEGLALTFKKDASGNFISDTAEGAALTKTPTGFELFEVGVGTYTFNTAGKLTSFKDLNANTVTVTYDAQGLILAVIDASGRQALAFTHNAAGRISAVTDAASRTITYDYDSFGNLATATYPGGAAINYAYNTYHGITSRINPLNETTTVEYQYPDRGVVGRVLDPAGTELLKQGKPTAAHQTLYAYDFKNGVFYVTDANGVIRKKTVNSDGALLLEELIDGATSRPLKKIEYLQNRTEKVTDGAGVVTTVQRDEWNNVIRTTDSLGNETRITYTPLKRPYTITDPLGTTTRYDYDDKGNLTKLTRAVGKPEETATTYTYDTQGQLTTSTTDGATTTIAYNANSLPQSITDPLGSITTFEYDTAGNLLSSTNASGNKSSFSYDPLGNLLTAKDPLGNSTSYSYNAAGRPTKATDPLNRATIIETDFAGRTTATTDPLGNRREYGYDGNGNMIKVTEGIAVTTLAYDASNRLTSVTDPEGNSTTYNYPGDTCPVCTGNTDIPIKITDPLNNITENLFDKAGRVTGIKDPMGYLTNLVRDTAGRVSSRLDANGNATKYQYDALGRITSQADANSGVTSFAYDKRGNLTSLTDPEGNTTTFAYDLAGRKVKETRPMGQATEYTYYPNGLLKTVKDAKNQTTNYTYDKGSRLTEIAFQDGTKYTFGYDSTDNMTSYATPDVTATIAYDALKRKTSETITIGGFTKSYSCTYDTRGNKASFTTPEGTTYSYTYNMNNQPTQITTSAGNITLAYQWNRQTKTTLPNGITTEYAYNVNSWLTDIKVNNTRTAPPTPLTTANYGFDKVGNITAKTTEAGNHNYGYDPTNQLTSATIPMLPQETYTYDKVGNRQTSAQTQGLWSYDKNNELLAYNGTSFTYDANGNTITKTENGQTTTYVYNSADRMERVLLSDGRTATYTYDPFGRRVKKDVGGAATYYLYADEGLIGEYDASGIHKKGYGWVPDSIWGTNPLFMVEGGNYYFYQNDHLGTPQKMADVQGNFVWGANYTSFGKAMVEPGSSVMNNLRFPGQYLDSETGLHYNWHRNHDTNSGRYIKIDPLNYDAGDYNLYAYSGNEPINYFDPLGLDRLINPFPSGPNGPKITFINDDPKGKSPYLPVSDATAEMIEKVVIETGLSININSTTGGKHSSPKSLHYQGRAVDIDTIDGVSVRNCKNSKKIQQLQEALKKQKNIYEDFGPYMVIKKKNDKFVAVPKVAKAHKNHIHAGGLE